MKKVIEVLLLILVGFIAVFFIASVITGIIVIFKMAYFATLLVLMWSKFWAVLGAAGITIILLGAGSISVNK